MLRKQLELDDSWTAGMCFDDDKKAQQECNWLSAHNDIREYMLVRITPELDDEMPF